MDWIVQNWEALAGFVAGAMAIVFGFVRANTKLSLEVVELRKDLETHIQDDKQTLLEIREELREIRADIKSLLGRSAR